MVSRIPYRPTSDAKDSAVARNPGILIADDKGLTLALLKFELEPRGFTVWLAMDGESALDLFRQHCEEIDLVLLNVWMPGLEGPEILAALQSMDPSVLACFMTANDSTDKEQDLLKRGAAFVFNNAFRLPEIAHILEMLAGASEPMTTAERTRQEKKSTHAVSR